MSSDKDALVFSILKFLSEERAIASEDVAESLEVAEQCLETSYSLSATDGNRFSHTASLLEIFNAGLIQLQQNAPMKKIVSNVEKQFAEQSKAEGNDHMREEKYPEALACYTKSIDTDPTNAIYYCNRAAALSKLNKHEEAIDDCNEALKIDSTYSKAYGRKGLALSSLNRHKEAKVCLERAIELDPGNETFKQNLELVSTKLNQMPSFDGMAGMNLGGMDFSQILNNPALMNMATNMLQNPQMQSMMSQFMAGSTGNENPENFAGLLSAGQQLAQQLETANPDLVAQLRTQMRQDGSPNDGSS